MIVEGYREIKRAIDNDVALSRLYFCSNIFQGENEQTLISSCRENGVEILECSGPVFHKISYRERPDGLLAVAPHFSRSLDSISLPDNPLLVVAESIEKPGNLGTILRSADAAGVDAVLVCDKCTDIHNPNVIRSSIGTVFSIPVVELQSESALEWLKSNNISIVAATPHADVPYSNVDLTGGTAFVLGSEQYGLSKAWLDRADIRVSIPMLGQSDSLNVASAATILVYEAVRQRQLKNRSD